MALTATAHTTRMETIRRIQAIAAQISTIASTAYSTSKAARTASSTSITQAIATDMCNNMLKGSVSGSAVEVTSAMQKLITDLTTQGAALSDQLRALPADFT